MSVAIAKAKPGRALTILCVDDHTMIGDALTKVFTTAGYAVERAEDGRAALEKAVAELEHFDVVITDHQMPRLDGLGLVAGLRSARFSGRIIVYSSGIPEEEVLRYRAFSVDAIVIKSPDAARLLAIVEAFHGER